MTAADGSIPNTPPTDDAAAQLEESSLPVVVPGVRVWIQILKRSSYYVLLVE
jgi:hypothetical protein